MQPIRRGLAIVPAAGFGITTAQHPQTPRDGHGFKIFRSAAMTPQTITLVRQSWQQAQTLGPAAAALFYEQLFTLNPALRTLFHGDMALQGQRLLAMLGQAVAALEQPASLAPVLQALGRRHAGYGVEAGHYEQVGQALLATLALGLGQAFTAEQRAAWVEVYGVVSHTMLAAASAPQPADQPG
jgi:methyl-accepting chemotaxis protein